MQPDAKEPVVPIVIDGEPVLTLRQIDRLNGVPKGSAFRAFKRARSVLAEGRDFHRLDAAGHGARIERLRSRRLVYASTVHLLVFTRVGYERLCQASSLYANWEGD